MNTTKNKPVSLFLQSALALEEDFSQFARLSAQLENLSIESEHGLEQSKKLLLKFSECGERIGEGVQALAKTLNESRLQAEANALTVSARAELIQARSVVQDRMLERFQLLGESVRTVTTGVSKLKKPDGAKLTPEEKAELAQHLPGLTTQLGVLVDESRKLKEDAAAANMVGLEKNAHSLSQTLHSVQNRLAIFMN